MTRTCPRCGDRFAIAHVTQRDCARCEREVAAIIERDTKRRAPRFPFAKSLDGWTA
jgi:hypothetical protein